MPESATSFAPPPSPPEAHGRARAFTLLELLMVMTLIAILATITMVLGRGIGERSKIAQARAELAVLAAALEQYKQQYGDYPWTPDDKPEEVSRPPWDGGATLFNALNGNLGPRATPLLDEDSVPRKGRVFVDLDRFTLASTAVDDLPRLDDPALKVNWFNDPWGKWYYYHYKKAADDTAWKSKGFLLYSHGPDEDCDIGQAELSGLLEDVPDVPKNADNIYHGRN